MNVRYRVELNQCERDQLIALLSGGKRGARKLKRAQILLAADRGANDEEIARSIGVGGSTVYPDQAPLCARQPGGGAQRRAAPGRAL
jgi:Homeodomain-like domain